MAFCKDFVVHYWHMDSESQKKQRILGIDFGSKRIGVAVSDEERKMAFPVSVIQNTPDALNEVEKIAKDNLATQIVLGESRNYKGEGNKILLSSMKFKEQMEAKGFEVIWEAEFMSSIQAERIQGKNDMLDASAAAVILQGYLDRMKED